MNRMVIMDALAAEKVGRALEELSGEEILSQSFVYLVSARADARGGNNFWARVLNGCNKIPTTNIRTMGVSVAGNGRFVLLYNPEFVKRLSMKMLKLVLVHEAGHIVLRHHERLFRILATVEQNTNMRRAIMGAFNIAADYADNDAIVRHEEEFKDVVASGEWMGLLPEKEGLPTGQSFEEYVLLITKDAEEIADDLEKMVEELEKMAAEQGEGGEGGAEGEEESDGEDGGSSSGQGKTGAPTPGRGRGGGSGKQKGPESFSDDPADSISPDMEKLSKNEQLMERLRKAFEKLSGGSHQEWEKKAEEMTSEEATSTANRLKQHAKQLAKSAFEQTIKARGFVPGHIQSLVAPLLKDEQVPWHWIFADCVQAQIAAKVLEGMATPNAALINADYCEPWPGHVLDTEFQVVWITDTSGSMSDREVARGFAVFNAMMSVDKRIHCRHIQIDANIQYEADVDNIDVPEPSPQSRHGGGGTVYGPAFRRIVGADRPSDWSYRAERCEEEVKKPDLVIVLTDGGVSLEDCFPEYHPGCPIIWLVTPQGHPASGMLDVPPDRVIQMFDLGDG